MDEFLYIIIYDVCYIIFDVCYNNGFKNQLTTIILYKTKLHGTTVERIITQNYTDNYCININIPIKSNTSIRYGNTF